MDGQGPRQHLDWRLSHLEDESLLKLRTVQGKTRITPRFFKFAGKCEAVEVTIEYEIAAGDDWYMGEPARAAGSSSPTRTSSMCKWMEPRTSSTLTWPTNSLPRSSCCRDNPVLDKCDAEMQHAPGILNSKARTAEFSGALVR